MGVPALRQPDQIGEGCLGDGTLREILATPVLHSGDRLACPDFLLRGTHAAESVRSRGLSNLEQLAEQTAKESEGAIPCLLGPDRVVLGLRNTVRANGSLIGKRVMREIAMEVILDVRCA